MNVELMKAYRTEKAFYIRYSIIIIFLSLSMHHAAAQSSIKELVFNTRTATDGLFSNDATSAFRDSEGFLWVVTGEVINKYDGYSFYPYQPTDEGTGWPGFQVNDYFDTGNNLLYFATDSGLIAYNREFDNFSLGNLTRSKDLADIKQGVRSFITDNTNTTWAIGKLIAVFDSIKNEFTSVSVSMDEKTYSSGNLEATTAVYIEPLHQIWIGTGEGSILLFDIERKAIISTLELQDAIPEYLSTNSAVSDLVFDRTNNMLWAGLKNGLLEKMNIFTRQTEIINLSEKINTGSSITGLFSFNDTSLWVGMQEEGVVVIHTKNHEVNARFFHDLTKPGSLSGNRVSGITTDKQNIVWITTRDGGLSYYDPSRKSFRHYTQNPYKDTTFSNNSINSLLVDKTDKSIVYIATDKGGLNVLDLEDESIQIYRHDAGDPGTIGSDNVIFLEHDIGNKIWVSTWAGGLNLFDPSDGTFKTYWNDPDDPYSIPKDNVWGLLLDSDNTFWVGFHNSEEGGMAMYDRENDRFIRYGASGANSLGCNTVMDIYEDSYGLLWFSHEGCGITKFDKETGAFTHFAANPIDSTALASENVWDAVSDNQGRLWIATDGGLHQYIYEQDAFRRFRSNFGLPDAYIYSLQVDENNNIWMGTAEGLFRFNPDDYSTDQYTKEDGLQSKQFKRNSSTKDGDRLFFGGIDGFNVFRPSEIKDNQYIPGLVITNLLFDNQPVTHRDENSPLKKSITKTESIVLSHKESTFGIEFAALNLSNPEKNMYKYQLIGLNDTLIDLGFQHRIYFNNLTPGNYTLHIIGSNNDGYFNREGIKLDIKINKPFHQTAVFYILIGFIIIAMIIAYQRFRKMQHQQDKEQMQEMLEKEDKELQNQKEQVIFQKQAIRSVEREDFELKWINTGLANFSSITSQYRNNMTLLAQKVISFLIEYLEADQGEIYITENNGLKGSQNNTALRFEGGYAAPKEHINFRIEADDKKNPVIKCFLEEKQILLRNTKDFTLIKSGLGEKAPRQILLTPIKHEEVKEGVILIGSFTKIKPVKREFIQKIGNLLAVVIRNTKLNQQLSNMVEESQLQSERLQSQQEEIRQNIEEMTATREEYLRKQETYEKELKDLVEQNEKLQAELDTKTWKNN